ncbi:MAG TPA: glycosyltransferase family 4 protein [Vicinamibacterales bacterium]|nr:glycosyltransferase family 4 protein [Vicinamibacterales bacterium]
MRVFVASGIYPPDIGGPATHLSHLLPALQGRGHDVRVLAYGTSNDQPSPVPVTRVPPDALLVRQLRYGAAYRRGARWGDVVYAASLGLPRPGPPRPTVLRVPGDRAWERSVNRGLVAPTEDIDRFQRRRYGPRVGYLKWLRAREARKADRVIVPSEYLRAMVEGWGVDPARVRVIHSALPDPGRPPVDRREARRALGWEPDARYVLTAARLTAWKGVDYLIEAVAHLPDVTLVVAGEGPSKAALVAHAAARPGRVQFVGAASGETLRHYLRACDYLVLYSAYEGLSHTILEALLAGTPVIASNRGGNPEIVIDQVNGLLVPHPDRGALLDALRRALADGTQERLAAGTAVGLEKFSWPPQAAAILAEIEAVAHADIRHE